MLSLSPDLAQGASKDPRAVAADVTAAKNLLTELLRVATTVASLEGEREVVSDMNIGLDYVLLQRKPAMAALFLHRKLNAATCTKEAAVIRAAHEELKEITSISGKKSFQTLHDWDPFSLSGSGEAASSAFKPPSPASGRVARGRQTSSKGRNGGRRSVVCSKCAAAGKPANHSHATCPQVECHKCHQKGHIIKNCPN